jgi:hypothetical protein
VRKVVRKTAIKDLSFLDMAEYTASGASAVNDFTSKDDEQRRKALEALIAQMAKTVGISLEGAETSARLFESNNNGFELVMPNTPPTSGKATVVVFCARMKNVQEAKDAQKKLEDEANKNAANKKKFVFGCHNNVLYIGLSPYSDKAAEDLKKVLETGKTLADAAAK